MGLGDSHWNKPLCQNIYINSILLLYDLIPLGFRLLIIGIFCLCVSVRVFSFGRLLPPSLVSLLRCWVPCSLWVSHRSFLRRDLVNLPRTETVVELKTCRLEGSTLSYLQTTILGGSNSIKNTVGILTGLLIVNRVNCFKIT